MSESSIRVTQWGTGNTGSVALQVILGTPTQELGGVWAHNPALAGGDARTSGTGFTPLTADKVTQVVAFALSRPANLALNTVVLHPVGQGFP